MFAFEVWGKFASFRDPFTISQNITLPVPPKSTVAGMMASVLGIENYLQDEAFGAFDYSVITVNPVRKKSFSQNYINDYTSKVQTQLNSLQKEDVTKLSHGLRDRKNPQKPINRELLIDPRFTIVINNFGYESKLVKYLSERVSKFPFYLGNSEYAANFRVLDLKDYKVLQNISLKVDSFLSEKDIPYIDFQENIRYSTISFAGRLGAKRTPEEFLTLVVASSPVSVTNIDEIYEVTIENKPYCCRFV
jgi:CRISPR-associated protein Cas5h